MEFENNAYFWQKIDTLFLSGDLVIERPKGSSHPLYANMVYPVDYGYLKGLTAADFERVDVFCGSGSRSEVSGIVVCADILKKDLAVKFIVGCSADEENEVLEMLNQTDFQKCVVMHRGHDIPSWAVSN